MPSGGIFWRWQGANTMQGTHLVQGRRQRGWTQAEAAARLQVSQSYLSRLEQGARPVPPALARRAVQVLQLPATALPLAAEGYEARPVTPAALATQLAALGYPGLAYLQPRHRPANPAATLLAALNTEHLEMRLVEALPWLVWRYPEMDWHWLIQEAKRHDCQNRLGYVVSLARQLAEQAGETDKAASLAQTEAVLAPSRLAREDTLCHNHLTAAEQAWLRRYRPAEAAFWNLLTDSTTAQLNHSA
jgi:transcriptional regulator with XRE-family HTH domain